MERLNALINQHILAVLLSVFVLFFFSPAPQKCFRFPEIFFALQNDGFESMMNCAQSER